MDKHYVTIRREDIRKIRQYIKNEALKYTDQYFDLELDADHESSILYIHLYPYFGNMKSSLAISCEKLNALRDIDNYYSMFDRFIDEAFQAAQKKESEDYQKSYELYANKTEDGEKK